MRTLLWVLSAGIISGFISPFIAGSIVKLVEFINSLWNGAIFLAPVIAFWIVGILARYSKLILGTGVDFYKDESVHIGFKDLSLKYISTTITLGFGGSGGLVSPILFLGKGMSNVFSGRVERIFTVSFASGMLTYYLGTPLSASLLAVEYFERDTVSYDDLMPALLSAMISDFHARAMGFRPIFVEKVSGFQIGNVGILDVFLSLIFAVIFGGVGMSVYLLKYSFRRFVEKLDMFRKTILSGLLVSLVGIIFGEEILGLKIFLGGENVIKLVVGKILATVFTIESLGSSGYFTPLTTVGMNLGFAVQKLGLNGPVFSVVGISALLSSMLNIPIAAVVFPVELFGYNALIPAAIGSSVSYILFKRFRLE